MYNSLNTAIYVIVGATLVFVVAMIIYFTYLYFNYEDGVTEFAIPVPLSALLVKSVPIKTIRVRAGDDATLSDILKWNGSELYSLTGMDIEEIMVKKYKITDSGRLTVWTERI